MTGKGNRVSPSCCSLADALFNLPATEDADGPLVTLPEPTTRLPREKPAVNMYNMKSDKKRNNQQARSSSTSSKLKPKKSPYKNVGKKGSSSKGSFSKGS